MYSERISEDIPRKMKILNMVIPILMHYSHFFFKRTAKMYFVARLRPVDFDLLNVRVKFAS